MLLDFRFAASRFDSSFSRSAIAIGDNSQLLGQFAVTQDLDAFFSLIDKTHLDHFPDIDDRAILECVKIADVDDRSLNIKGFKPSQLRSGKHHLLHAQSLQTGDAASGSLAFHALAGISSALAAAADDFAFLRRAFGRM